MKYLSGSPIIDVMTHNYLDKPLKNPYVDYHQAQVSTESESTSAHKEKPKERKPRKLSNAGCLRSRSVEDEEDPAQ